MTKIVACVTTRDGKPDWIVYKRLQVACQYAANMGIEVNTCVASDPYSVAISRNRGVAQFLKDTDATHLFFLDNDVHIQQDVFQLLLDLDSPVAVGCYPSFKSPHPNSHLHKPYLTLKKNDRWILRWFNGPLEVEGAGTGCMLIRRDVLESMSHPWFRWYEYLDEKGDVQRKSDDIDFCDRIRDKGFSIVAHGNVRCGHIKETDAACFIYEDKELDIQWLGPMSLARQEAWPDYGSHVPALQGVLEQYPIKTVVEYGAGRFSTPVFLDSEIDELISYESSVSWLMDVQNKNPDPRLAMKLCPVEQMANSIHPEADLVFIDCDTINEIGWDGKPFDGRLGLIRAYENTDCIVVVHDCNFKDIRPTVESSAYQHRAIYIPPSGPHTAVLSNKWDVSLMEFPRSKRKELSAAPESGNPVPCGGAV